MKLWSCDIDGAGITTWRSPLGFRYKNHRRERYDVPLLPPLDPPDDWPDLPEPSTPLNNLAPPDADEPPPPERPLDVHEIEQLYECFEHGWGYYSERVFNLLNAAQLV